MSGGAIARAHRTPAPRPKARKGARGRKNEIGRGFHHGSPAAEERAIERAVRQSARREIGRELDDR